MKGFWIIILSFLSSTLFAQTFTWTGAGDGTTWQDPANWDQGSYPNSYFHHVVIANEPNVQTTAFIYCRSLRMLNSKLNIPGGQGIYMQFFNSNPTDSVTLFLKNSEISNNGIILIQTYEINYAIELENSVLNNLGQGNLEIREAHSGIIATQAGKIFNQLGGRITMDVTNRGMVLGDSLLNRGFIQIDYDKVGVIAQGAIDNRDSLIIKGNWITADSGLVSHQTFKNRGYVFIEQNNLLGFRSLGTFENFPQGNIEIENTINTGQVATAFYTNKKTENNGRIYIYNVDGYGIINDNNKADFDNNGEITLLNVDSTAFIHRHTQNDMVLLKNTGKITISNTKLGIENTALGYINNTGTIRCLQAGGGILNQGWFLNIDSLFLSGGASPDGSEIGFLNTGKFFNHKYTEIKVFINYGLQNTDSLRNETNALLFVQSCGNNTGKSAIHTNSIFLNYGEIKGDLNLGTDIINESNKKGFYNFGKVNLSSTFGLGIINFSSTADSSFFNNIGRISIKFAGGGSLPYPERGLIWNHSKGSFKSIGKLIFDELYLDEQIAILNQSFFSQGDSILINKTEGIQLKNSGVFISNKYFHTDLSLNNFERIIINSGNLTLRGNVNMVYQPSSPYVRTHFVENTGTINNKSHWIFEGNYDYGGIINDGIINNDSLMFFLNLKKTAIQNTGVVNNSVNSKIIVDFESTASNVEEAIYINEGLISNAGEITINESSNRAFWLKNGSKIINSNLIKVTLQRAQAFYFETATDSLINQSTGTIDIDSVDFSANFLLNGNAIRMLNGYFENNGNLYIKKTKNRAIEISGGNFKNSGLLTIDKAYDWDAIWLINSTFVNSGILKLNGATTQNLRAIFVNSSATFDNSFGTLELIDQAGIGLKIQGSFIDNSLSKVIFTNNTRNTGVLFEDQTPGALVYKGSMIAVNSKVCALFDENSVTEGKIDLRNCTSGLNHNGTNVAVGHIQIADNVLPKFNYGLVELSANTRLASTLGSVQWTNYGIINDKTNGLVNIKFYQTATPPVWPLRNEGLYISPFYGVLSNGIKENTNLTFTTAGTLPVSTQWYSSRTKTTVAGDWHATGHYFTPNGIADASDSLFFEYSPVGGSALMVGIPHIKPGTCPNPPVVRSLNPSFDYNWNAHSTWQGNRMPDYCDKVILSGQEGLYVPTGYKAKLNTIDFTPQPGNGRFFELKTGAVMEINALPYH